MKTTEERKLYTFVGECRSPTAIRKDWVWTDGRLAAAPLFEALHAMGIEPGEQEFVNLYKDPPLNRAGKYKHAPVVDEWVVGALLKSLLGVRVVVALGARVSTELIKRGVDHVAMVHPAARGRIRKRSRYIAHVRERLS
jgi:hypothetical protein